MKNIQRIALLLLTVISLGSCQEFLDVNTDPNNPTEVAPALILPVGMAYTATIEHQDRGMNHLGNMLMYNWSQSDGFSWYEDEFLYAVTPTFYEQIFEDSYSYAMKQYSVLENLEDADYAYYKAIGKIMNAYHYQILVDTYGDVPYSDALGRSLNATPKYDTGLSVYEGIVNDLTAAIDMIENAPTTAEDPKDSDAVFHGEMSSWIQFANSLKLRVLTRQMSMSGRETYIVAEFAKIQAQGSGFYMGNVGINPGYIAGGVEKQNPMWDELGSDATGAETASNKATCASDFIITYLTDTGDPRISFIFEQPADGHLGVPQGLTNYDSPVPDQYEPNMVSNIGPGILKSADMDAVIYTEAELYFNLAEAALKGYVAGSAQEFFETGITASFNYLEAGDASAYLSQSRKNISWANSTDKMEAIITQKWVALIGINAEQSWFDYNRTGFPLNLPLSRKASTPNRPTRLAYPASEISSNGGNVPTQPNVFNTKIFWAN